jgi:hypothetical protein
MQSRSSVILTCALFDDEMHTISFKMLIVRDFFLVVCFTRGKARKQKYYTQFYWRENGLTYGARMTKTKIAYQKIGKKCT